MIQTVIHHKVQDYEKWKQAFDKYAPTRKEMGEVSYSVGRSAKDPSNVYVINEWASRDQWNQFMNSPSLKEAMAEAGVDEEPHIAVLEETAKGAL